MLLAAVVIVRIKDELCDDTQQRVCEKRPYLASASVALTIAHTATNTAGTPGKIQRRKTTEELLKELPSAAAEFSFMSHCARKADGSQVCKISSHVSQKYMWMCRTK